MDEDIAEGTFFCYDGAIEGKNVRKSLKSRDFGFDTFFVKGSNMDIIATIVQELKTRDPEFYCRYVHILFILPRYLSHIPILVSYQLVAVE